VGPRADLDDVKRKFLILPGLELQPLARQAHSQSLYRLRYNYISIIHVFNDAVSLELGVTSRTEVQRGGNGEPPL
jgi:hypothetical protein